MVHDYDVNYDVQFRFPLTQAGSWLGVSKRCIGPGRHVCHSYLRIVARIFNRPRHLHRIPMAPNHLLLANVFHSRSIKVPPKKWKFDKKWFYHCAHISEVMCGYCTDKPVDGHNLPIPQPAEMAEIIEHPLTWQVLVVPR